MPGLIILKTRFVGSNMRAHTAKAWNCLPENKFPPPSAPVLQAFQKQGRGWQEKWSLCLGAEAKPAWDSLGLLRPVTWEPGSPVGRSASPPPSGSERAAACTAGGEAGLLAHCTSLCIPSLFPMQIKLMRIRDIMEPIHRSSRWKMGSTTNFPLQLFCNYRGIL